MLSHKQLYLRAGELVIVRPKEQILSTLDAAGSLDALPFMPEMLQYCGLQFRVYKRADKTCDTIDKPDGRRMYNTVHLEMLRCDGSAHGGCDAGCLLFWKEDWLQRVEGGGISSATSIASQQSGPTETDLHRACVVANNSTVPPGDQVIYSCQATRLKEASKPLAWWDVRQYLRDLWTHNAGIDQMVRGFTLAGYEQLLQIRGYRALVALFNWWQHRRGSYPFPWRWGSCDKTPTLELHLQPGEWVRVKPYEFILTTLNKSNRNRGMWFDPQMVQYCGCTYRVHKRVQQIIHEKHGYMIELKNPAVILENIFCRGEMTPKRLFCPRAIYIYWREIWLERVDPPHDEIHQKMDSLQCAGVDSFSEMSNSKSHIQSLYRDAD